MKVLAVGDIHTKTWIIDEVEKIIHKYDAVVFVGDYADDFNKAPMDTIKCWERLKALSDRDENVHMVMGNHDYIYVNKTPTSQSGYSSFTQTLIDMPEYRDLRNWLRELPITVKLNSVTYSHAGLIREWDMKETNLWQDRSPLWVRPSDGYKYKVTKQVFGHTPSETCWEVAPNIWCIDTFSTYADGTPFGDGTVLEVIDGKQFNIIKLKD